MKINFNKLNGNYEIIYNGFSWVSDGRKPYLIVRKKNNKGKYISTIKPFWSTTNKQTEISDEKIIIRYSGFIAFGKIVPFTRVCTAEITSDNTVEFSLDEENEIGYDI